MNNSSMNNEMEVNRNQIHKLKVSYWDIFTARVTYFQNFYMEICTRGGGHTMQMVLTIKLVKSLTLNS